MGGEMHNAIFAQLRPQRGRSTRLEIQSLHALPLRDEGRYCRGFMPCAEQSPETRFGADHSRFPAGSRHLQETDVRLIRIGGSDFIFGPRLGNITPDSRIVISE